MPRVSSAFFAFAALCLLIGMLWGMHMAQSQDMVTAPAHAHLNLLGWVTMSIYGAFYALTRETASIKLAWINFVLSALGVLLLVPHLAFYLVTNQQKFVPGLAAGSVLVFLGFLVFFYSVLRELFRKRA